MAISYVGQVHYPATENVTSGGSADPIPFDKDDAGLGSMQSGDFVMAYASCDGGDFAISATGGQTWTEAFDFEDNTYAGVLMWCIFNGTWTADPTIDCVEATAWSNLWGVVLRGVDQADPWDVDPVRAGDNGTAFDIATFDTLTNGAWAFVGAGSIDNNTWTVDNSFVAPSGSGNIYWRNATGTDSSIVLARKVIDTAGAVGATTMTQTALGPDAGQKWYGAIKPAPTPSLALPGREPRLLLPMRDFDPWSVSGWA